MIRSLSLAVSLIALTTAAHAQTMCFRPEGPSCEAMIVGELNKAHHQIRVSVYNWTLASTGDALINAFQRGVDVSVIVDKSAPTEKGGQVDRVVAAGIPVAVDCPERISHDKIAIIDQQDVITGSFNWSESAEKHNAENAIMLPGADIAASYLAHWKAKLARSTPYTQGFRCNER